ncbi:MAG: VCBS repeat-containing protein, partial [Chloroflexi bacterium]|nr:VCBS repeat-containing protein [Chloroflexota bacterium]
MTYKTSINILMALGLALALSTLALGALPLTSQSAQASEPPKSNAFLALDSVTLSPNQQEVITSTPEVTTPTSSGVVLSGQYSSAVPSVRQPTPLPDWVVALLNKGDISTQAGNLAIVESATTASAPADGSTVINGQKITYTITITNSSSTDVANNIVLLDVLPENTLSANLQCDTCGQLTRVVTIPAAPFGGLSATTLTYTDQITWPLFSLGPNQITQRVFSIDVPCKAEGALLQSQAFISYQQGGSPANGISNQIQTRVLVSNSDLRLAEQPSWCADDVRGVFDLDWGDFDRDGDLDLVLGTTLGVIIYQNDKGQLKKFSGFNNTRPTFSARWGDFDVDGNLEVVAVGGFSTANDIYEYNGSGFNLVDQFTSPASGFSSELFAVASGDFDRDGDVDLVGGTNGLGGECRVHLYENNNGFNTGQCISQGSSNVDVGDFDNDGDLDLALGLFDRQEAGVLLNDGVGNPGFTHTNAITFDANMSFSPYQLAWGDYDGDGYLDIAEALPREFSNAHIVRIFHNNQNGTGLTFVQELSTGNNGFGPPLTLNWGDFNGDGRLDLAVGDLLPKIYLNTGSSGAPFNTSQVMTPPPGFINTDDFLWEIRGADEDNNGNLDLALTSNISPSLLFINIAPFLIPTLAPIDGFKANSVAWGDTDGDGDLDLLFGAGPDLPPSGGPGSRLYRNISGTFALSDTFTSSGFGPHDVAFADVNGDGQLDVTLTSLAQDQIYFNGNTSLPNWSSASPGDFSLAWADVDLSNSGSLDMLVGGAGQLSLFLNQGLQSTTSAPAWQAVVPGTVRCV